MGSRHGNRLGPALIRTKLETMPAFAFVLGFHDRWSDQLASNLPYAYGWLDTPEARDPLALRKGGIGHANLVWQPTDHFSTGVPQCSIVGEVFGTTGEAYAEPQWKAGVRWEHMPRIVVAATYGRAFSGDPGARLEIGASIFTDPFLCRKGCRK